MKKLKRSIIRDIALDEAALAEASYSNPLLPATPGWDLVLQNPESISRWVRAQLRSGFRPSEEFLVGAQKGQHGLRPFAVWGIAETVLYRALVDRLLDSQNELDRGVDKYRKFLLAPIQFVLSQQPRLEEELTARDAGSYYIVKTDISSFYNYIDHEILANELSLVSDDFELIEVLFDLLREVQGRQFGLPQGLHASHRLSEFYISLVERNLVRQGLAVWRFNDDFRIVCQTYSEALDAIEQVDLAARDVGLVMNEYKTTTPHFDTYVEEILGLTDDEVVKDAIDAENVDQSDSDDEYSDWGSIDADQALTNIRRVRAPKQRGALVRGRDIRRLSPDILRELRLSWDSLRRAENPDAIRTATKFLSYTRSLTPNIVRYLGAVAQSNPTEVRRLVAYVVDNVSLNDWQRGWLIALLADRSILGDSHPDKFGRRLYEWLDGLAQTARSPMLQAQAVNALAHLGFVSFDVIDDRLQSAPSVLSVWYVDAARAVADADESLAPRYESLLLTTPQARWMLLS